MATLEEIASGVVTVLKVGSLDTLPLELRNHSPDEASFLAKAIVDGCAKAGVRLRAIRIAPSFAADLLHVADFDGQYAGVPIELDARLGRTIEFVRQSRGRAIDNRD